MDLFRYLMVKNGHNYLKDDDLFSYKLAKGQGGTYAIFTGTTINANNTRRGKMKVNLLGNTSQETTTGKNLLPNNATTQTISGITFTKNSDGTITANGTASSQVLYVINENVKLNGNFIMSGSPTGSADATYFLQLYGTGGANEYGSGASISNVDGVVRIVVRNGATISNKVFEPMIRLSSVSDSTYEPYTNGASPNPSYPQPVNVVSGDNTINVCGKNLFDIQNATGTKGNNTFTALNQEITINSNTSGTESASYLNDVSIVSTYATTYSNARDYNMTTTGGTYTLTTYFSYKPDYTFQIYLSTNKRNIMKNTRDDYDNGKLVHSVTLDDDEYIKSVQFYTASNNVFNNLVIKSQLEKNSSSTPYEPYTSTSYPIHLGEYELCKIGTYQDRFIKTTGKNLFSQDFIIGSINAAGEDVSANNRARSGYEIVKENTHYRFSSSNSKIYFVPYFYDSSKTFISYDSGWKTQSYTFTTPANTKYIRILLKNNDTDTITLSEITEPMLNEGSTPLPYEPYGTGEWYLEKKIGKVVLDGSESIWYSTTGADYIGFAGANIFDNGKSSYNYAISNYFSNSSNNRLMNNGTGLDLRTPDMTMTTAELFKQWLSTHNTIAYYILQTPTYTPITGALKDELEALQGARSYDEQTNISQVNNDLSANMEARILVNE